MCSVITRIHSSRMRTARSSSCPGEGGERVVSTRPLLWPSGVVAFCYGLLPPPGRPYQMAAFNQKAPKPEGHNRRPQQKAITEGQPPGKRHPPRTKHPPGSRHPHQDQAPPPVADPPRPAARHAGVPPAMHAGTAPHTPPPTLSPC